MQKVRLRNERANTVDKLQYILVECGVVVILGTVMLISLFQQLD